MNQNKLGTIDRITSDITLETQRYITNPDQNHYYKINSTIY